MKEKLLKELSRGDTFFNYMSEQHRKKSTLPGPDGRFPVEIISSSSDLKKGRDIILLPPRTKVFIL